jgi:hypothetical protein
VLWRLALLSLVVLALFPAGAGAAVRYAAPSGAGPEPCASANPCSFAQAVSGAASGDEVIVTPGTYPISSTVTVTQPITIHGATGGPRPILQGQPDVTPLQVNATGTRVSDLRIEATGPGAYTFGLYDGSVAAGTVYERLELVGQGFGIFGAFLQNGSLLRDSIVRVDQTGGPVESAGVVTGGSGAELRNVTVSATGAAVGVWALGSTTPQTTTLVNVIARADATDLVANSSSQPATLRARSSNFAEHVEGSQGFFVDLGGNQSAAPVFVDAGAGDFRQLASSPTVDAGTADPQLGLSDLDGDPRTLGGAPDIGADELPVPPAVETGGALDVRQAGARLTGSVNPRGLATSFRFEYGATAAYGQSTAPTAAGAGLAPAGVEATLTGLAPGTTYHYRLVASNSAGEVAGADMTFTTQADTVAPTISGLRLTRRRFAVGPRPTPLVARARRGSELRFSLSEPARVRIRIERLITGHRRRGRCLTRAHSGRRCTIEQPVGTLTRTLPAGAARIPFSGRLGRKRLRPGRYRLTATATDAAGNRSRPAAATFTIMPG